MMQPLEGIRVLDFGWIWSGPLVAGILSEFGAEVIKIEHRGRLDNMRLRGAPVKDGRRLEGPTEELNPYFNQINHNKAGLTINIKRPEGTAILHRLAAASDVVTENLTPGALSRSGLGYDDFARINPRIIMLSMASAGQTGPMRDFRAYAPIMSAYCGLESVAGYPGEEPLGMMNFGYGDPNAAAHALLPLLGALIDREQTGKGRHIDMSQIEALVSAMPEPIIEAQFTGQAPVPTGNRHRAQAPHGIFPCRGDDCWIAIAVPDDAAWSNLLSGVNELDALRQSDLKQLEGRLAKVTVIEAELARWTATQDRVSLISRLRALGLSASPVLTIDERMASPDYQRNGLTSRVTHPYIGDQTMFSTPWVMSETPPRIVTSAPLLGQDNERILCDLLGFEAAEIRRLEEDGIVA